MKLHCFCSSKVEGGHHVADCRMKYVAEVLRMQHCHFRTISHVMHCVALIFKL